MNNLVGLEPALLGIALSGFGLVLGGTGMRSQIPLRIGPWPGLTPTGGTLIIAAALVQAGFLLSTGSPSLTGDGPSNLWYVPLGSAASVAVWVTLARLMRMPGAASAACGGCLLPWSTLALMGPVIAPPPLILSSAIALDLALWLRSDDFRGLGHLWPVQDASTKLRRAWRPRNHRLRTFGARRAAAGGALAGVLFALLEPPYASLLRAVPTETPGLVALTVASPLLGAATGFLANASPWFRPPPSWLAER